MGGSVVIFPWWQSHFYKMLTLSASIAHLSLKKLNDALYCLHWLHCTFTVHLWTVNWRIGALQIFLCWVLFKMQHSFAEAGETAALLKSFSIFHKKLKTQQFPSWVLDHSRNWWVYVYITINSMALTFSGWKVLWDNLCCVLNLHKLNPIKMNWNGCSLVCLEKDLGLNKNEHNISLRELVFTSVCKLKYKKMINWVDFWGKQSVF